MASSAEIEREVEHQRASVESTLDALRQKMSFGQIADEVSGYVGTEDAKALARNLGRQVRDNPLALGLIGAGVAWLMLGGRARGLAGPTPHGSMSHDRRRDEHPGGVGDYSGQGGWRPASGGETGFASVGRANPGSTSGPAYGSTFGAPYDQQDPDGQGEGMISRAAHAARDAAGAVGETLSGAKERVTEALSGAAGRVSGAVHGASDRASGVTDRVYGAADRVSGAVHDASGRFSDRVSGVTGTLPGPGALMARGRRGVETFADTLERQPLLVGAFAAVAGVAIGAALPATRVEDRYLGERRDEALIRARSAVGDLGHQAAEAAKAGVRAATEAAREEGLAPEPGEGRSIVEKVEHVVRAGVAETRRSLDPRSQDAGAA